MPAKLLGKNSPHWKQLLQLDRPAVRRDLGLFLAEGPKLLPEALRGHHRVRELIYDPERFSQVPSGLNCWQVSSEMLDRLSDAHQGVVAVMEARPWPACTEYSPLVVCDGLSDPGNLGTLMRTAWATGVAGLVCLGGVDLYNSKVVRASAGAVFHLPSYRLDDLSVLAEYTLIGLEPRAGTDLYRFLWPERWGLVVGNEAHGLSVATRQRLGMRCTIPMEPGCESLNAATSVAVVLFEWRRQRRG
ncbi:RNA methyltransferase [bacterium]|nr:RNA methyltransferase [bacterium]